jgi:hypothetical protein
MMKNLREAAAEGAESERRYPRLSLEAGKRVAHQTKLYLDATKALQEFYSFDPKDKTVQ